MLRGHNHTRNAQTLGEIPMNDGVLTLPYVQTPAPPPSVRAPLANAVTLLINLIFGPPTASTATTSGANQRQTVDAEKAVTASVVDPARDSVEKLFEAVRDAILLNGEMLAAEEGDPLDSQTLQYALQSLAPLIISLRLPPPLILPLQGGGIGAEWHTSGMNIELRFRKPYDVYALLEDARGTTPYHGRDPDLAYTHPALQELSRRHQ